VSIFMSKFQKVFSLINTYIFYRHRFNSFGLRSIIIPGVRVHHPNQIAIGEKCFLDTGVILDGYSEAKRIGIQIGDYFVAREYAKIEAHKGYIKIGNNCFVGQNCMIYGQGGLEIGNNVLIAVNTVIIPSNHNFSDLATSIKDQGETSKGIFIEDNVWIGANCTILDGVRIGSGSVIAAGSVVNRDISPNALVAGIPAKFIKCRASDDK
jgi:acetyltransferase-like isoleucine patch superfamily enzyme